MIVTSETSFSLEKQKKHCEVQRFTWKICQEENQTRHKQLPFKNYLDDVTSLQDPAG